MKIVDNSKSKSGRPKLSYELRRQKNNVPLNAIEKKILLQKSSESGMPLSVFIRNSALQKKIPVRPPRVNIEALDKLSTFLDKLIKIDEKVDWQKIDEQKVYSIIQESEQILLGFRDRAFS